MFFAGKRYDENVFHEYRNNGSFFILTATSLECRNLRLYRDTIAFMCIAHQWFHDPFLMFDDVKAFLMEEINNDAQIKHAYDIQLKKLLREIFAARVEI